MCLSVAISKQDYHMALFTFETLPDEILMMIFRYSGTVYNIFRTFSGLNQRLNRILIDIRLHLLTDFLFISPDDPKFNLYYNSVFFNDISRQLLSSGTIGNDKQLRLYFQSLMTFHIENSWKELKDQYQSNRKRFQSARAKLSQEATSNLDLELSEMFESYNDVVHSTSKDVYLQSTKYIEQIESLVLKQGARLECDDHPSNNFAYAVKEWLFRDMYTSRPTSRRRINAVTRILKILLISNPNLIENRVHVYTTNWSADRLLFFSICEFDTENYWAIHNGVPSRCFYKGPINIECYLATLDLLLYSMQCMEAKKWGHNWTLDSLSDVLQAINYTEFFLDHKIFISTIQIAILKIVLNELYDQRERVEWDGYVMDYQFGICLQRLVEKQRLDALSMIYEYSEKLEHLSAKLLYDTGLLIRGMHGNPKYFLDIIWYHFSETQLKHIDLFILLKKKECKLVKKLFKRFPILFDRCDEDGNDPLLYVCLKVRGCRHRLVEFLLEMGCDYQRKNSNGEHFAYALRLERNRHLIENLFAHEIIHIDDVSGQIKVIVANRIH